MKTEKNENCWLVRGLGREPNKRCEQCDLYFRNCPLVLYFFVTTILIVFGIAVTLLMGDEITKSFIVSVMVIIFGFGYFSNRFTSQLIEINFKEKKLREDLSGANKGLELKTKQLSEKVEELERFTETVVGREIRMMELKKKARELEKRIKN